MTTKRSLTVPISILYGLSIAMLMMGSISCKPVNLEPFKELARTSHCSELRNRLFLIDKKMVFWDRRGNCPDNSFAQRLYEETPDRELCLFMDSIIGPKKSCKDEKFREMFETMIGNLERDDLGLASGHQVEPVPF